jgi:hypothetical protein
MLNGLSDTISSGGVTSQEFFMRPLKRSHEAKRQSVGRFKHNVSHTKAPNVSPPPMRGGFRL